MCSIPGLPTPGTDVPVLITRVNLNHNCGLVELWVNMDNGRKHVYEQMREEIQNPVRKFDGSEGKPADLCLVCISDAWHRARIVSIQSETCNVFLIDQGQPHITTSEALAWGQSDSFLLPPESESCILANVLSLDSNWPEKATKFLVSLPGKKFMGLVQHVLTPDRTLLLDIPMVTNPMCMFGVAKKMPVDEFKCFVQKCLEADRITQERNLNAGCQLEKHDQYLNPELLTDTFENVEVTEVTNPHNIFCKLLIFSKAVKILSEQIQQHYEESSDIGDTWPLNCGDPCAARGINGRWYRSLLKRTPTSDGAVEVFHVDEGTIESVPIGDIRPLHRTFLRLPVFTYPCSFEGVKDNGTDWTTDQTDYLKSVLLNQTFVAKFNHHNIPQGIYPVILYADNYAHINNSFIEMTEHFLPSKTEQDSNVQNEHTSFLSSLDDKLCIDLQNNVNVGGILEETLPRTKNLAVNDGADDLPTSGTDDTHVKESEEHPDPLIQINEPLSTGFPAEVQNACDDDGFTVGSSVNVKVSFIESLQKFWCQKTGDSLGLLMQDLQNHYASAHPQPLVESICVARNPDNNMWYRAKIMASHESPVVDVRFIDYGQTEKVPLRDVCPIDPAFLRLNAQAFQCCFFNRKNSSNSAAITWTDAAESQKLVDVGTLSNIGLKCTVKAVTSDEEGLLLYVVDIETPSDSAGNLLLTQEYAQDEAHMQNTPQVLSDKYNYSTHNIEADGKEKVWITSSENVNRFYCQLDRNFHRFVKVMENVKQLICQPQCTDHPLERNSICFARYTDNEWYRGQVEELSPKLKLHFVDYGETLAVNECDICPFPTGESLARSLPVQAIPLGLCDVPAEVPQEVNQWFADHAIGQRLTILVVAKGEKGKLIVELFDGSLNVNAKVREMLSEMIQQEMTGLVQQADQSLSNTSEHASVPNEDCLTQVLPKMTEQKEVHSSNGTCASSQCITIVSALEAEHEKTLDEGRKPTSDVIFTDKDIEVCHSDSEMTTISLPSFPEENVNVCMYKWPNIYQNKTVEVYASCIVGPHYFWCQSSNTEDLNIVSRLAQEAGRAQQDMTFPETIGPGSPCLALFSSDEQWYRAQVIHRVDDAFNVMFIDYGNESDVDIKNVRSLPQSLLEKAPQAFLCSLNGFDKSSGSWDDDIHDDFYNLLVDKPLGVTVLNMDGHSEAAVPQYAVEVECEGAVVNAVIQKYWKPVAKERVSIEHPDTEMSLQDCQTESNLTHLNVSKENINTCMYKEPSISKNEKEEVYASCIVHPHFFWCQSSNTEELNIVSRLAQEAGQAQQDMTFPETLGPGSPCLALFSSDEQWYRAQVIHRVDDTFNVMFIDYGNESDVDIKNLRSLPQSLLEKAPQAFLCSLNGFDKSSGSWDDDIHDDFYNLLVDKPLGVTVLNMDGHSEAAVPQYAVEVECEGAIVNAVIQKYWKPVAKERVSIEHPETEMSLKDCQTESNLMHLNVSKENVNTCMYKEPSISKNEKEEVYASCIVHPHFFWCQSSNTEELNIVSRLAQEAGQAQQDMTFPETLGPGSPCLALFSSDEQWYRAQVIDRVDDTFNVVFIDYGNESDIDVKNLRSLPQSLLEKAPQAFLCSLNGFDKSSGSWDDDIHDDFYNLLVDKPLGVTVLNIDGHSEAAVPQYAVEVECEGEVVNILMEKYWKGLDTDHALEERLGSVGQDDAL
ncbi:tudor domain-containing protein 6-like [Cottoperca gobio]|uniref:Tudor domain-containing protein 6-like n=1 Tax=Cottoperca gobio TaxID=56716 RepID=A0A6J2PFH2_COTGO|nr:tudor domain-containing protein 6-like [Cottoperca gobio]